MSTSLINEIRRSTHREWMNARNAGRQFSNVYFGIFAKEFA